MGISATALIVSSDTEFAQTMRNLLQRWEMAVELAEDGVLPAGGTDIVLLDIRRQEGGELPLLPSIRQRMPGAEIILVNRQDNIQPSIAGMQAGADDEIIVPFATDTLKNKIITAIDSRKKRRGKRSFFKRIEDAMNAITFAQAGEFDTAVDLLNEFEKKDIPLRKRKK